MFGFRTLIFKRSYILLSFILLFSCNENKKRIKTTHEQPITVENDSLENILAKLNAKQKSHRLDSLFNHLQKRAGFNGNVLIAQQGTIIFRGSYGYSRRDTKDSLKLTSAFQLGSSTKPITATAVLMLKDRGLLDLSQTVDEFFPDFPYKKITVKALLTHRTGLPNYMYFCDNLYCYKDEPLTNDALLKIMTEKHPTRYSPPNKKFNYSNTNYGLLACIIEKVSGKTYSEFVTDEIFKPLYMFNTWVSDPKTNNLHTSKTIGYETNWKKYDDDYLDGVLGDKNIFTTVDDLFLFDQAMHSGQLLKEETLKEAYTGASRESRGERNYGYGWRLINRKDGTKIAYHNGWWHGYNNVFWRRLNDKTTIIVLSNRINRGVYQVDGILNIIDGSEAESENNLSL